MVPSVRWLLRVLDDGAYAGDESELHRYLVDPGWVGWAGVAADGLRTAARVVAGSHVGRLEERAGVLHVELLGDAGACWRVACILDATSQRIGWFDITDVSPHARQPN